MSTEVESCLCAVPGLQKAVRSGPEQELHGIPVHEGRPCQLFWTAKKVPSLMCCACTAGKHSLELHMASDQFGACVLVELPARCAAPCPAGKHGMELHMAYFKEKSMLAMAMKASAFSTVLAAL